jgi:hypothetical protein
VTSEDMLHFHTTFGLPYHYLVNQWTEADGIYNT